MKKNNDSNARENASTESSIKNNSSALAAAAQGRAATDRAKAKSTRDVNGNSGLRNTGTNVSYEDKE